MELGALKKLLQEHLGDGLVLIIGSGLSCAEGVPGMGALGHHLVTHIPPLLSEEDDGVRAAAITGLCQIGAIDEAVVRRLAAIVSRAVPAGHELRGIAVQALARTDADAQNLAVPILAEVVRDPAGEDATVLFAARSLAHLAGDSAKSWIAERAERSPDPLRSHLHAIVQGAG